MDHGFGCNSTDPDHLLPIVIINKMRPRISTEPFTSNIQIQTMLMQNQDPFGNPLNYDRYLSWLNEIDNRDKLTLYKHRILNITLRDIYSYQEHIQRHGINIVHLHLIDIYYKVERIMSIVNGPDEGIMNHLLTYNEILAIVRTILRFVQHNTCFVFSCSR